MPHDAATYTVRVKVKGRGHGDDFRLLGDFDLSGGWLGDALVRYLADLDDRSAEETRSIRCESCQVDTDRDEVLAITRHGQSGVSADLLEEDGSLILHQLPRHTQEVRCGVLFSLPQSQPLGFLVVHLNNGRSPKTMMSNRIFSSFRHEYEDLMLLIEPCVAQDVLQEAVEQGWIEKIRLLKYERPSDSATQAGAGKWVRTNERARIELGINVAGRGGRITTALLRRFLRNEPGARSQIVEFNGMTFEQAKVEVVLPDNSRRTYNIEKPDAGHAITQELANLELEDNGEPIPASVFQQLRAALAAVAT